MARRRTFRNPAKGPLLMVLLLAALLAGCDGINMWSWPRTRGQGGGGGSSARDQAEWVIVLLEFRTPGRQAAAERAKEDLLARKWTKVWVLNDADRQISFVMFGPFKYGPELDKNLKSVRAFKDRSGNRPFVAAYMMELPSPDPAAPKEWNLVNAPGYWSLQIGHFVAPGPAYPGTQLMDLPKGWNRKQAAVDACRELRQRGFEAYYYHGDQMSMVTVGTFPREAFNYIADPANPRYEKYDPQTDEYLDPKVKALRDTLVDGQPVFRCNLQNTMKVTKVQKLPDGRTIRRPLPSFLVRIPRPGEELFGF